MGFANKICLLLFRTIALFLVCLANLKDMAGQKGHSRFYCELAGRYWTWIATKQVCKGHVKLDPVDSWLTGSDRSGMASIQLAAPLGLWVGVHPYGHKEGTEGSRWLHDWWKNYFHGQFWWCNLQFMEMDVSTKDSAKDSMLKYM